jgi:hypothetical protein
MMRRCSHRKRRKDLKEIGRYIAQQSQSLDLAMPFLDRINHRPQSRDLRWGSNSAYNQRASHGCRFQGATMWDEGLIRYVAELNPLPEFPGADPGPGGRIKPEQGPWKPGNHELDKYLRDGEQAEQSPFRKNG